MTHRMRARTSALLVVLGLACTTLPALAQQPASTAGQRALATREELSALATSLERTSPAEARTIRERLATGDFQVGDRLLLRVQDEQALTDSFTIRTGQVLELPNIPPIPMRGILRSEAERHLRTTIARYLRDPVVRVEPLVRIAFSGAITRPGFHALPADVPLADAIMTVGGPSGTADLKKVTVRRAGVEVASRERMRQALAQGATLDQLSLQGGDEITIGERGRGFGNTLQVVGIVSGLLFGVAAAANAF